MADTSARRQRHNAAPRRLHANSAPPASAPEPPDPIAITRSVQSAVLRLRMTILAMKSAADGEHENPHHERLFWPDLMDALTLLTPDADVLDVVVDELQRA
ncbi:MAG: hypothetical protein J0H69_16165 [Burkholderiales bacterium]|jgi:hypothetical protein|nr:hypothetical protein [Burkholderiales bacterium]